MSSKKKLSIAHLHWGFPPTIGGVETHLALMLPKMVERGHQVSLLTGAFNGMPDEYDYKGVKIYRNILMDLNWLYKRGHGALIKEVKNCLDTLIEKSKPDVLHAHNMHYFQREHTLTLAEETKKHGIPLVLTAHNIWEDALFLELTRDIPWQHIIAVSNYIKRELVGIGCEPDKITAIHHGIDTSSFKPGLDSSKVFEKYPQIKGKRVIFHPARLCLSKGCDLSIKALNIIKDKFSDAILMMAGSKNIIDWGAYQASDIAYFVDLVNHFGLEDKVIIDSYPIEEMPYIYNLSEVVLYPSTAQEPFGMTMLEAFACKKSMIVTNSGGMPEIVKDGENGFVIDIKNFDALANRIEKLLDEPELNRQFGEAGYKFVQNNSTANHVTDANLAIYNKVLNQI